jgi:ComF family protein
MGEWLGEELRESGNFDGVDVIVPIPLHYRRRMRRGYNQSEQLALGVGRKMGVECDFRAVCRNMYNDSQTLKSRAERWDNVAEIFEVRHAKRLRGRHILLIDDVLTTGTTVSAAAKVLLNNGADTVKVLCCARTPSRI